MRRTCAGLAIVAILCSISLIPVLAQEDQSAKISEGKIILEKSILASGGREYFLKIRDTTTLSELKIIPMGLNTSRVTYTKGFEKARIETKAMGTTTVLCFDGKSGWIMTPQTISAVDMPRSLVEELKKSLLSAEAQINPDKFGIISTYEGKKSVEDKEYLVIKQAFKDGETSAIYIDPGTYLPYKTIAMALNDSLQKVETETIISDYRDIDGRKVPFSFKIIQGGKEYATISISSYKYNTDIPDSLFERP